MVHRNCLERWVRTADTKSCEVIIIKFFKLTLCDFVALPLPIWHEVFLSPFSQLEESNNVFKRAQEADYVHYISHNCTWHSCVESLRSHRYVNSLLISFNDYFSRKNSTRAPRWWYEMGLLGEINSSRRGIYRRSCIYVCTGTYRYMFKKKIYSSVVFMWISYADLKMKTKLFTSSPCRPRP